jgi:hypothetical protein
MQRETNIGNGSTDKKALEQKENISQAPKKFPRSVFFILGNEFCERYYERGLNS